MSTRKQWEILFCLIVSLMMIFIFANSPSPAACQNQEGCRQLAVTARQPLPTEMVSSFEKAGTNKLGSAAPPLPQIYKGYPTYTKIPGIVPCDLLKAVAYVESGWKQFNAVFGQVGPTLISFDCGFGAMQITTGMRISDPMPNWDPARVASEVEYNIGTGALFLVSKWNAVPNFIGDNNPFIIEDWYYALWAYNGFSYVNNPNNQKYPADRTPFNGTQPRSQYPYQELVYGYLANPPKYNNIPYWNAISATLPDRKLIGEIPPRWIPRPAPYHFSCGLDFSNFLPVIFR